MMGRGQTVLLLHGGPGLSDYMWLLEPELEGFFAVGFQQRGLPPSAVTGPLSVERHVADAVAILSMIGAGEVIAVGHSWGGHLALQLALAHPQLVSAVVTIDSLGITGDGGTSALHDELRARLTEPDRARCAQLEELIDGAPERIDALALEQLRILWPSYFAKGQHAPDPPPDLRLCVRCNQLSTGSAMRHLAHGAFAQRLRGLQRPVVALAGQQSPMPTAIAKQIAETVPTADFMTIPNAGHLPWLEQPGCVRRALTRANKLSQTMRPTP